MYTGAIEFGIIEQYTSDRYWRDWRAKKVKVPPLPSPRGITQAIWLARSGRPQRSATKRA